MLPTAVEFASERLDLFVDDAVRSHIASLGEAFATRIARIRSFTSMASFVGLGP